MIIETKEVYKCEHCRKLYQIKTACEKHEFKCLKNPDNFRICHGCDHLEVQERAYYYDTFHGEDSRNVKVFYCSKVDTLLYPIRIELGDNGAFDFGDILNKPMKKECKHFEEKNYF